VRRPRIHLVASAHLDPAWQWRWEEGAAEAIATFRTAAALLREYREFIFNHNEAVLYRWVERYDPALFREIGRLVRGGRWSISGGWYLQPDLNLPGLEALVRQIVEGRRYFWEKFGVNPRVAYNFDSFGHSSGLPQVLRLAGYKMYIHMRPQSQELTLPSDLYRWRGADGSEVLALRIAVGLYHTERDNIEERLEQGTKLALKLNRDVPVFWGLGDHGGGATRSDLEKIRRFRAEEKRVEFIHSTPERLYDALRMEGWKAPLVEGDLQRVFTGCYTSLARVKRRAEESLGAIVQAETLAASAWWLTGQAYPAAEIGDAWRDHLLNDFHDILTGSCTEPAEKDAVGLYAKVLETARRVRLGAAAAFARSSPGGGDLSDGIPVTVSNAGPSLSSVPVEVEVMADYRPLPKGEWHLRLFGPGGKEISSQEEQPEALLPFNGWRRKLSFVADLPRAGCSFFWVKAFRGRKRAGRAAGPDRRPKHKFARQSGFITSVDAGGGRPCLRGPLLEPLVIRDEADAWGTGVGRYRDVVGRFKLEPGSVGIVEDGPVRTIRESQLAYNRSRIILRAISYSSWPWLEFKIRVHWSEERRMLKLAVPTVFGQGPVLCDVPGGAVRRPQDGEEHVFGRWALVEGDVNGRPTALAVIGNGQHGLDCLDGEMRLSVLRSAAYCHERGFRLGTSPARKYMDLGVHEVRLIIAAGDARLVRDSVAALADWLSAPPFALAHLPLGEPAFLAGRRAAASGQKQIGSRPKKEARLFSLAPANIRVTACKQSWDGRALILRLHESAGRKARARLELAGRGAAITLQFGPYEIKTVRLEKNGDWHEVDLISES
jgi:alpha-mannosidase